MARVLHQRYYKTITMPEITSAVVDGDELTIEGVDIAMRFRPERRLRLGFSSSPDLVLSWPDSPELVTSNPNLVIDLSDYDGEDLTDLTYYLPGSFSIDFDVSPDDDIVTPPPVTPPNITGVTLSGTDVEISGTNLNPPAPDNQFYSLNLWFPAVDGGNFLQINMAFPESYPWMTVTDNLITLDTTASDANLDYFAGETFSEIRVTWNGDEDIMSGSPMFQTFDVNPDLVLP